MKPTRTVTAFFLIILMLGGCAPKWQLAPLEPPAKPMINERGMVVAAQPLAAKAGISVLKDGGNAVDAALAALFMLNVVEPHASGLGGGGFALVRMADGTSKVVNYREKAPKSIDPDYYYDPADSTRSRMKGGGTAVCVPGAASGWGELYKRWATMPLERLARDAIRAAEQGFVVDPTLAGQIGGHYQQFESDPVLAKTFLKIPPGFEDDSMAVYVPYDAGDTLRQPMLAKTLKTLVKRGLNSFYRGPIAEAIVQASQADSGYMTTNDLEFYRADVTDPIAAKFGDYELLTIPPPSRGGTALVEMMNLFEVTDAAAPGLGNGDAIHLLSQCIQQAYSDTRLMVGDPNFVTTDWQKLLTPEHAKLASNGIDLKAIAGPREAVQPVDISDAGNTTHLVVVDKAGNVVSLTQSINYFFGAGVMAGNTGLLLNNQMSDFSTPPTDQPETDTLNYIVGGKRPRSNMTPLILLKNGKPYIVIGTPGGSRIPAAVAQIIVNIIEYDLDVSAAIDYPRYFPVNADLVCENRFNKDAFMSLKKHGYKLHFAGPYHTYFGGAHGIVIEEGKLYGAADKRRGGAALGY